MAKKLPFRSLVEASQLSPRVLQHLFNATEEMQQLIESKGRVDLLADKMVALLFFEPSSRTMLSFQAAAQRLQAGTVFAQSASVTSMQKGESIEDLMRIVSSYADLIIMRHAQPGSAKRAADHCSVPFINAGDGGNEHPTQAIIDAYTIYKRLGRLNNLKVTFGFDALQSRSIHSLTHLLAQYSGNHFTFVGPAELSPSKELLNELNQLGVQTSVSDSLEISSDCDVIYVNRLQQERFKDKELFDKHRRTFRITPELLVNKQCLLLDPLPRIDEIDESVDLLPNAAYFEQASYGVPVRMALLHQLLCD